VSAAGRVLIVDDEPQIRKFLRIILGAHGHEVIEAATGAEAVSRCGADKPDLVVLDLGLPDLEGVEVIRRLREWSRVPIIVLSVRAGEREKVAALDAGANDYVTKPFGAQELLARVRAGLRNRREGSDEGAPLLIGPLAIDPPLHRVRLAGREIKLTRKEFAVLLMLAREVGRIVTHQRLLREIWGPAQEHDTHYLRIYVAHLRQKLGDDPADPRFIENEPGVGYRLIDPSHT
jgi:two-component system KDP operon response regulator KdpE